MRCRAVVAMLVLSAAASAIACGGGGSDAQATVSVTIQQPPIIQTQLAGGTPTAPAGEEGETPGALTPARGTPIPAGEVPPEAQDAVDVVFQQLVPEQRDIATVVSVTAKDWADSCLEVTYANQEEVCQQVVVPGWEIVVHFGATTQWWHTDEDGSVYRFALQEVAD